MDNLHNPARLLGESQADYRKRRAKSKAHADRITCKGLGNQRNIPSSREHLRDSQRANGRGPRATFGLGILQPQRMRNLTRIADTTPSDRRDEYGTFTLIGGASPSRIDQRKGPRRKWLGGISAQRGF